MQFGLQIPHSGPGFDEQSIVAAAVAAERLGLDSVWIDDHLLTPAAVSSPYPYAPDGTYPVSAHDPYYDALALIGILTARIPRLRVGTNVFVAPYRHPIVLAKALATFERFAPGRIVCGLGAGWMREEFDALGLSFERRGDRLAEYVAAVRAVWSGEENAIAGEFYAWPQAGFLPAPTRPIPIVLGAHAARPMRRAARIADGFAAIAGPGETGSLDEFRNRLVRLQRYLEEAERERAGYQIVLCEIPLRFASEPDPEHLLVGPPDVLAERLTALGTLGVTEAVVLPSGAGSEADEALARFAENVKPLVG